jgi:esterase/lipase
MSKVTKNLSKVTAPILIIQGDNDPVVKRESVRLIYDGVSSKQKKLLLLPRERHSILADEKCGEVFEAVYGFIETAK